MKSFSKFLTEVRNNRKESAKIIEMERIRKFLDQHSPEGFTILTSLASGPERKLWQVRVHANDKKSSVKDVVSDAIKKVEQNGYKIKPNNGKNVFYVSPSSALFEITNK